MEDGGRWVDESEAKFAILRKDGTQTITKFEFRTFEGE